MAAGGANGPYLGLQLAHAFLLVGDPARMDACLRWAVGEAAYTAGPPVDGAVPVQIVSGAWNEHHNYAVASDFAEVPATWWYMGDIPHGWAAAEFQLLMRDICFFESGEDDGPHVYLAPGVLPHWLAGGGEVRVRDAPTVFGVPFGFTLTHDAAAKTVTITVTPPLPAHIGFVHPLRLGAARRVVVDGADRPVAGGPDIVLPGGTGTAVITYE